MKIPYRIIGQHNQAGDRIEQYHPRSKNGSRNDKKTQWETTVEKENSRQEIRNSRCEHQQQNTRYGKENPRYRRFHKKHGHNNQRKFKNIQTQNIQEIQKTKRRPNLRIKGIDEN
jgi:hypothetical protein